MTRRNSPGNTRMSRRESLSYVDPGDFIRLRTGEAIGKIGRTVFPFKRFLHRKSLIMDGLNILLNAQRKITGREVSAGRKKPQEPPKLPPPKEYDDDDDNGTLTPKECFK